MSISEPQRLRQENVLQYKRIAELEVDLNALKKLYESRQEYIAEMEEQVLRLKDEVGDEWARAEQAKSALAERDRMLRMAAHEYCHLLMQSKDLTTDPVLTMEEFLAALRAHAKEEKP